MPTIQSFPARVQLFLFALLLLLVSPRPAVASDAEWVVDVSEVAGQDILGMCEDNDVLYFIGVTPESKRYLCAFPLDTKEILWSHELDPGDRFYPVIDEEGLIHIYSNVHQEAYTISPEGVFLDTTAVIHDDPPGEWALFDNGTIGFSGVADGYTHGGNTIGYGGMMFVNDDTGVLAAVDLFGGTQWSSDRNLIGHAVVNNTGSVYYTTSDTLLIRAYSWDGVRLWSALVWDYYPMSIFGGGPVIGSDGTIYFGVSQDAYGMPNNAIIGYSPKGFSPDGTPIPGSYIEPQVIRRYEGDPSLWDGPNHNPLMIVQDSLLCWAAEGSIEAFKIPSHGYQGDAIWPCYGHDNRRSFATAAPVMQSVTGEARWNGDPLGGVTVEIVGYDVSTITDENGEFAFSLPYGTYTIGVEGYDLEETIQVTGSQVSRVMLIGTSEYSLLWQSNLLNGSYLYFNPVCPAIDHNGNILAGVSYVYFGNSRPGAVFSLSPDGTRNWRTGGDSGNVASSPVVDASNTVYICQNVDYPLREYSIRAYNDDSTMKWQVWKQPSYPAPYPAAVGADGTVYVHSPSSGITGYDQTGESVWQSEIAVAGEPVIDREGILYVTEGAVLRAFNRDGSLRWTYTAPESLWEAALGIDVIYASGSSGAIYEITNDGNLLRTYHTNGDLFCSPAVDSDGTLYIGAGDNNVYALNFNGTVKWKTPVPDAVRTTPIIAADGVIFAAGDSTLYAINPDGSFRWQYELPREKSPLSGIDNTYIVLDDTGMLYCISTRLESMYAFQTTSPGIKYTAPWPCYRGNSQRTGLLAETAVAVEESAPRSYPLVSNYPNPFNAATTIVLGIPEDDHITVEVYNILGQRVRCLTDRDIPAGTVSLVWDSRDDNGSAVASGIYFVRMTGTHSSAVFHRMLFLQ